MVENAFAWVKSAVSHLEKQFWCNVWYEARWIIDLKHNPQRAFHLFNLTLVWKSSTCTEDFSKLSLRHLQWRTCQLRNAKLTLDNFKAKTDFFQTTFKVYVKINKKIWRSVALWRFFHVDILKRKLIFWRKVCEKFQIQKFGLTWHQWRHWWQVEAETTQQLANGNPSRYKVVVAQPNEKVFWQDYTLNAGLAGNAPGLIQMLVIKHS